MGKADELVGSQVRPEWHGDTACAALKPGRVTREHNFPGSRGSSLSLAFHAVVQKLKGERFDTRHNSTPPPLLGILWDNVKKWSDQRSGSTL